MPPSEIPILVVGGGPTGLTMALCLMRYGIKARVIEEAPSPHKAIRGTAIVPRTLELLDILGLTDEVKAVSLPPLQMAIYDTSGINIVKAFDWSQPEDIFLLFLSQATLEDVLRSRLVALRCEVEHGKKLIGINQDADKVSASVELPDGSTETIECAFLVAADGAKGHSRRLLGIPFIGKTKEADRIFTANVNIPGFSREYWHRWGDFAKSAVLLKPIHPTPLFQFQAFGPAMHKEFLGDVASLQRCFKAVSGREEILFSNASCITEWKANIRMTEKLSTGRVFLAGDVAHCHSPAGGQGTNTAMQDSFNLAWKLALVLKNVVDISLLSTYESERLPVIAEMLDLSTALHARAFLHIPDAAFASASATASDDPMARSAKLLQLGINYRWSPIVLDARETVDPIGEKIPYGAGATASNIRAGDRAPFFRSEDSGGNSTNLFRLLGECAGAHLVLKFPANGGNLGDDVGSLGRYLGGGLLGIIIVMVTEVPESPWKNDPRGARLGFDADGATRGAYGAEAEKTIWVAVRPDGIVGAYGYTVNDLVIYFRRLEKCGA
ncbi:FAD binding domain-containing protein [Mycena vulgaris]|nr:FAD binding domain-containing protein [Mycena vulgaris]